MMSRMAVVLMATWALVGTAAAADAGSRKLLQSNYVGYTSRFNVEAPQASRWSAGFATSASGPAQYSQRNTFTGPTPNSVAIGVNPAGGFAEWKDTARLDATLPRYSAVGRASRANTIAADVSLGTKLLPEMQSSTRIRPTRPVTLPVFSFGGGLLPTPTYSAVLNPREGVLSAPKTPAPKPAGKDGPAGKAGAGGAAGGGGGGDDGGDRRRLLSAQNYGYDRSVTARAPSTPQFTYYTNPPPAVVSDSLAVRADRPNLDAAAKIPGNLVTAASATNVVLGPQKPFPVRGKGSWTVINLSRGPSTVTDTTNAAINWGAGGAVMNNGNPLSITANEAALVPNRAHYTGFTLTPQIGDRPNGFVEAKSRTNIPLPGVGK